MEILIAVIVSLFAAAVAVVLAASLNGATYQRMAAKNNPDPGWVAGCLTTGYAVLVLVALGTGLGTYLNDPQVIGPVLFVLTVLIFPNVAAVILLAGYQACKFSVKRGVKVGDSLAASWATFGQRRETPKRGNS